MTFKVSTASTLVPVARQSPPPGSTGVSRPPTLAEIITINTEAKNNNIGGLQLMRSLVGKNESKD